MKLYVARHGQSVTNDVGIMAGGQDDPPLTPQGWMDAAELAANLGSFHGLIVSSPQHRAQQTAEFVRDQLLPGAPIRIDPDFRERDMGNATDKPREEYERMNNEDATIAGAETPEQLFTRVKHGLEGIREDHGDTLLVAHGGTCQMIVCVLQHLPPHEFRNVPALKNGEFQVFEL